MEGDSNFMVTVSLVFIKIPVRVEVVVQTAIKKTVLEKYYQLSDSGSLGARRNSNCNLYKKLHLPLW